MNELFNANDDTLTLQSTSESDDGVRMLFKKSTWEQKKDYANAIRKVLDEMFGDDVYFACDRVGKLYANYILAMDFAERLCAELKAQGYKDTSVYQAVVILDDERDITIKDINPLLVTTAFGDKPYKTNMEGCPF